MTGSVACRVVNEGVGDVVKVVIPLLHEAVGDVVRGGVDVHAGSFHEPVGVQGEDGAWRQRDLGGGVVGVVINTEEQARGQVEDFSVPVWMAYKRRWVSGVGETGAMVDRVEMGDQAARACSRFGSLWGPVVWWRWLVELGCGAF
jgi:hypothetical protein